MCANNMVAWVLRARTGCVICPQMRMRRSRPQRALLSVPPLLLLVCFKQSLGIFAERVKATSIQIPFAADSVHLLDNLPVSCPLFLDQLPELGVLSRQAISIGHGGVKRCKGRI